MLNLLINLLPLLIILIVYFAVAFLKPIIQPKLPFRLCAICAAVSAAWFVLLLIWIFCSYVSTTSLGILMGMSIAGIMYKMEKIYKSKKIKNFWLIRLVIIIGGYYIVLSLLNKEWTLLSFLALIIVFGTLIPTLLFQGITHEDVVKEQKKEGKDSSLIKKLDDCC